MFTTKLLIPAAGFGKRVGSPKAKELLELKNETAPLIEWALTLAKIYKMPAVVISREDKIELNEYLVAKSKDYPLEICLIPNSKEWPDSILKSESYWGNRNIVVLPDTRFQPVEIISSLDQVLKKDPYGFATFRPDDLSTWGVVRTSDDGSFIAEKPKTWNSSDTAWGLFGFQRSTGRKILESMLNSQGDFVLFTSLPTQLLPLTAFEDVGRSGIDNFKV